MNRRYVQGGQLFVLRFRGFFGVGPAILSWLVGVQRRWHRWTSKSRILGGSLTWGQPSLWHWRGRQVLHVFLLLAALYFFVGWFRGPSGVPPTAISVAIWRDDLGTLEIMELEEYVKGVVAAEMPASFHLEALKAQAVAARTYAIHTMANRVSVPGYPDAVLSTDHRVDQAWMSDTALRRQWGFLEYYWRWRRVCSAVDDTRGMVLTYEGNPILAVFHSDSGGMTEDSENYWSQWVPYLRSVPDPVDADTPYKETRLKVARSEVRAKVRALPDSGVALSVSTHRKPNAARLMEVWERYPSGRAKVVRVGDRYFTGRAVREALELRSTWFDVVEDGQTVEIIQKGNGHGVGMSQYGADDFARRGATYRDILLHYYSGVELTAWY